MKKAIKLNIRGTEFNGSCLCGGVRFNGHDLRDVVYCHCRQCRSGHGSIAAYTATDTRQLKLTEQATLRWYKSSTSVRRGFCSNCGSNLFWERLDKPTICVAAGAIDGPVGLRAAHHIYIADKAPYDDITDGLPQHKGSMYA